MATQTRFPPEVRARAARMVQTYGRDHTSQRRPLRRSPVRSAVPRRPYGCGCSGPWPSFDDVEYTTLEWIAWFNTTRLLEPLGYAKPAEYGAQYYAGVAPATPVRKWPSPRETRSRLAGLLKSMCEEALPQELRLGGLAVER